MFLIFLAPELIFKEYLKARVNNLLALSAPKKWPINTILSSMYDDSTGKYN